MTDQASFRFHVERLQPAIEAALERASDFGPGCPGHLREAIRYSLLAPGKRLRPMLVLLAAEACGGTVERAMPGACAVEMIHAYSLIHDDLPAMDDDDLRRGRPTCHKAFDEATAILAGDALQPRAFEILANEVTPPALAARCCAVLARAAGACALVGGQADDMLGCDGTGGIERLESIHRRKTGAMIQVSLRLGGVLAEAPEEKLNCLERYGHGVGLAFQITDDLLDVQSCVEILGKQSGKDARQGKLTFPGLLGIDQSSRNAREWIEDACEALHGFGQHASGLDALARYVLERDR